MGAGTPSHAFASSECEPAVSRRLATVTVTFEPDLDVLARQLNHLPRDAHRIVVDNGSSHSRRQAIDALAAAVGADVIYNGSNLGLARALNVGIVHALGRGAEVVLLLDQDTEASAGEVQRLVEARERLVMQLGELTCVGPRLIDDATGLDHGFHQIRGLRWSRVHPVAGPPVPCSSLNGSGTLASARMFTELGGPEDGFFIDHVDTEWSFRVRAKGAALYGVPEISFVHRMGEKTWRFWWFGWRIWPYRGPSRHYYLFRNATALVRRSYVPRVWKIWLVPKLVLTAVVHGIFDAVRWPQLAAMARGIRDGWSRGPERK
ncbi:glycosyltransferase family 2 protein [Cognatilysobacter terrigena]|uniref:glycosyltransferase family 2 protein n=1 Tax=Cognatilysobacter terrigena TaxID=2488749 RepID=UPI00105BB007|nr:glycosyltransferase family 2 protein [Lysobacter terrigena]